MPASQSRLHQEQVTSPSPHILLSPSFQSGCERLLYPLGTVQKNSDKVFDYQSKSVGQWAQLSVAIAVLVCQE